MARVLITGGAGFIGSNIARLALDHGYEVRILDNLSTGSEENIRGLQVQFFDGDLHDPERLREAMKGIKFVFHEAAASSSPMFVPDPSMGVETNVLGFTRVLNAARRNNVEKVVYAMTSTMYGNSPLPSREGHLLVSEVPNVYASSLLDRYFIAKQVESTTGIKTAGLVYFSVYGPYEAAKKGYANVASQFLWLIKRAKSPVLYGDGTQTRDFVHVEDVARANLLAAESNFSGGFVNVGTGVGTSMRQIVRIICKFLGKNVQPTYKSNPIFGYTHDTLASTVEAGRKIGFRAAIAIDKGLESLVKFYDEHETPHV